MLVQNALFRRQALGSFEQLLLEVNRDPAMILWLNGDQNRRNGINENYARELMELFTLGADRGAYSERDIRELARALSGWTRTYTAELGHHNFRFDAARHDAGMKTVFGLSGTYGWEDACRLCLYHPGHPTFFVSKLWSYFIASPPPEADRLALEALYVNHGFDVRPVLETILRHPLLHAGPTMAKPPVVLLAGMLRAVGRGIDRTGWTSSCSQAGQRLFRPPDVSGWDATRWLDTSTMRGRWVLVAEILNGRHLTGATATSYPASETAAAAVDRARGFWQDPPLPAHTAPALLDYAGSCLPAVMTTSQQSTYRAQRQNSLRQLIAASPDYQVC
jgi:uncharacterized protein (DUF1800 family)